MNNRRILVVVRYTMALVIILTLWEWDSIANSTATPGEHLTQPTKSGGQAVPGTPSTENRPANKKSGRGEKPRPGPPAGEKSNDAIRIDRKTILFNETNDRNGDIINIDNKSESNLTCCLHIFAGAPMGRSDGSVRNLAKIFQEPGDSPRVACLATALSH